MAGERTLPGLGLKAGWTIGSNGYGPDIETNFRSISAVLQGSVKSRSAALPGTPAVGDIYIVKSDDPTNPNKIAVWDTHNSSASQWNYITPKVGWCLWNVAENAYVYFSGAVWQRVDENSNLRAKIVAAIDAELGGAGWKSSGVAIPLRHISKTASYLLANADFAGDTIVHMTTASAAVITVPAGMTNLQPITIIREGDGALTITAAANVTIQSADGRLGLRSKFSSATLIPKGGNIFSLIGDLL